jgi:iron complex transport system permease protein
MKDRGDPLILALALAAAALLLGACLIGPTPLPAERIAAALIGHGAPADQVILWEIRAPRALAAFAVGGALGVSGAALQGLLRNPLAEPGVLGVSASSALFATCAVYYGLSEIWAEATPISAIAGALAATALLAALATRAGSAASLILIGVGLSSFSGALMALLMNFAPNPFTLSDLVNWMLGSVANRSFADLALAAPFLAIGVGLLMLTARNLSALTLGEEAAAGIGLDPMRTRLWIVLGAGLATGAAVAIAGVIGFVGIVAPHLVRPFVGHDPARTLLPAGLLAGSILTLADILVRVAPTESELKLGVVAALIGAPAFVWIAATRRGADA